MVNDHTTTACEIISTPPPPPLHTHTCKVIDGMEIVRQIEDCGTSSGEPTRRVQIAECGQIPDEQDRENGDETDGSEHKRSNSQEENDERDGGGEHRRKRARVRFAGTTGGAGGDNEGDKGAVPREKGDGADVASSGSRRGAETGDGGT